MARFLQPDAKVPITGKPLELLKDKEVPADELQAGRLLYDLVNKHMTYDKSKPGWGQGDAVWACGSGFGNCSDGGCGGAIVAQAVSMIVAPSAASSFRPKSSMREKTDYQNTFPRYCHPQHSQL